MSDRGSCPYVGLQPFTEADRDYFFGRERDTRLIAANLQAAKLTVLYGASGVGKSSVLMAGALPMLRRRPRTAAAIYREWQRPDASEQLKRSIVEAVTMAGTEATSLDLAQPLDELMRQAATKLGGRLLLILDQFEEYFTYYPETREDGLDAELARAVNRSDVDGALMLSLREDSLHKLDRLRPRIVNLLENRLQLAHLDEQAAEQAIRKPIARYNERHDGTAAQPVDIQDELVVEVLRQVRSGQVHLGESSGVAETSAREGSGAPQRDGVEIETPFLQLVMTRLWDVEIERASPVLRLQTLHDLGGADRIVRSHLDDVMAPQSAELRDVCARFFDRLVTPSGTKIALGIDDLMEYAGRLADFVPTAVKMLTDGRILRSISPSPGKPEQYEIFHDVLAPAVIDWRARHTREEEGREAARKAAEREAAREKELRAARTLAEERDRRLIEATRRAGLQRRMSTRLGWLLMLSLVLTVFSIRQCSEATKQRDTADAARLAAQAQWKLDEHFDEALLLATEGVQRVRTSETTQALLAVLARLPSQRPFLRGHAGSVANVAFSPDGRLLATGSDDGTVILWDVATRQPVGAPLEGHADPVTSVAFSPDGTLLATGSKDRRVMLWDMASRQPVGAPLEGHRNPVTSVAFSPDGTLLATGSKDRTVVLWNVASRQRVGAPLQGHRYPVTSVAFSPDGTLLATGSDDKTAILWNVASGQRQGKALEGHTDPVTSLAFSPDGTLLATGSDDKTVILWNVASHQPVGAPLQGHRYSVTSVAFSPDGTLLATGSYDKTVILRDVASRQPVGVPLQEHKGWVTSVAFSPDGTLLATGSKDTTAILWTVTTRQPAAGAALEGHKGQVTSLAFAPSETLLATGSSDRTAILWDVTRRQPVGAPLQEHKDWVTSVAFSPDGMLLATGSRDKTAILWDVTNHQRVGVLLPEHKDWLTSVAFSPDGKMLATGSKDKTVILWDVASRQRVGTPLEGHEDSVTSLAFSPDGKLLATGGGDPSSLESGDNTVILWDLVTRQQVRAPLKGHEFKVNSAAFSPDGTLLATGSDDKTAILWDVASGQRVGAPLQGHTNSVTSLAFSPDGKLLATGSTDKTVMLWDVASRSQVGDPVAAGHEQPVRAVAFSPSGKLLALGLAGSVPLPVPLLWDLENPDWASVGCAVAVRNLSCSEWRDARGQEAYRKTCAALPAPTSCERGRDAGASEN